MQMLYGGQPIHFFESESTIESENEVENCNKTIKKIQISLKKVTEVKLRSGVKMPQKIKAIQLPPQNDLSFFSYKEKSVVASGFPNRKNMYI